MTEPTREEIEVLEKLISEREQFRKELIKLINKYSLENDANTPDFIIADCMISSYLTMNEINFKRDEWYGVHLEPGNKYFKET